MTIHISIPLEPDEMHRASEAARAQGVTVEDYLRRLVSNHLPTIAAPVAKADVSILFDMFETDEPTDIARDKDKMVGEAVWKEHLRKTGQT